MESGFASAARNSTRSNEDAALTIQRAARGRQARLAYRAKKVAAARIQSRMRGQMARKEVTNRRGGGTTIGGLKETNRIKRYGQQSDASDRAMLEEASGGASPAPARSAAGDAAAPAAAPRPCAPDPDEAPKTEWRKFAHAVSRFLDNPSSSKGAQWFAMGMLALILASATTLCLSTLPKYRLSCQRRYDNATQADELDECLEEHPYFYVPEMWFAFAFTAEARGEARRRRRRRRRRRFACPPPGV